MKTFPDAAMGFSNVVRDDVVRLISRLAHHPPFPPSPHGQSFFLPFISMTATFRRVLIVWMVDIW